MKNHLKYNQIKMLKHTVRMLVLCFMYMALFSCKKANEFYNTLANLPQISNNPIYAYKTTYVVGDTLKITGRLPYNSDDFTISVGGIIAPIVDKTTIGKGDLARDKVAVIISAEMVGKAKEVKVVSGGISAIGASIDVYTEGGEGSFTAALSNRNIATFNSSSNIFLHCVNGKGDVYYFAPTGNKIYQIRKDGTQIQLYDLSVIQPGNISLDQFISGGITPDGRQLYFSIKTTDGDYVFAGLELSTHSLRIINRSSITEAPFEGNMINVKTIITDIYPDNKGNVYVGIDFNTGRDGSYIPGAIARYQSSNNTLKYLIRDFNFAKRIPGLPGADVDFTLTVEMRLSPTEDLLYLMQDSFLGGGLFNIEVYDLPSIRKIQTLNVNTGRGENLYDVITNFQKVGFRLAFHEPESAYGYLPMPGRRLQVLMYQQINGSVDLANTDGFPRWIVLDFPNQRTYAYSPGRFRIGNNAFRKVGQRMDELLNYDEEGHLYTTANGRTSLIATRAL
jgi:hypothetical protein